MEEKKEQQIWKWRKGENRIKPNRTTQDDLLHPNFSLSRLKKKRKEKEGEKEKDKKEKEKDKHVVAYVAVSLDVRGFAYIAQLVEPCDALLAVLVDHVALSLDVRGFVRGAAQIAIPHIACAPKSLSLRRVSIQKPASRISQLSRRENVNIFPDTNL